MSAQDPYQAPNAAILGSAGVPQNATDLTDLPVILDKTKPWLIFIGVLNFIGSAIYLLMAIVTLVMGDENFQSSAERTGNMVGGLLGGVLFLLFGLALVTYASTIGRLRLDPSDTQLEAVVNKQYRVWRAYGFVGLTFLILLVLALLFSLLGALAN